MRDNIEFFLDENLRNTYLTIFKRDNLETEIKEGFKFLRYSAPHIVVYLYPKSLNQAEEIISSCIKLTNDSDIETRCDLMILMLLVWLK